MSAVIEVQGLVKRYGSMTAVAGASFEVMQGEIFGVVGPNGAGKTSMIECLEGLRKADAGTVRVLGLDPYTDGGRLRQRIGVQLQQAAMPDRIKVWEALDLFASYYDAPVDWRHLIDEWGLAGKRDTAFSSLSGGQQQRLFITLALVNNPSLVFLDELTTGLDPHARRATWDLICALRDRGVTVVLVTHFMEEAERLCDRVAVVDQGRIITIGKPAPLVEPGETLDDAFVRLTGRPSYDTAEV